MRATIRKRTWRYKGKVNHAWRLDWTDGGKRYQKQYRTRQEAHLALASLLQRGYAKEYGALITGISFLDFYRLYDREKMWRSLTWRERVRIAIEKSFARFHQLPMTALTEDALETFKRDRMREVKPSTVRNELTALSSMCSFAVKHRYLRENPVLRVEKPAAMTGETPARYIPPEDLDRILAVAGRDGLVYTFDVASGLRASELVSLRWDDLKDGFIYVIGKGSKKRLVPLLPQALETLKSVPRHLSEPRVFWWLRSRYEVSRRFRRRLTRAGLAGQYRFHDLRHTFASYAAMAGVDLEVIAGCLGHASKSVTKMYAHLSPNYKRKELEKMAAVWPGTRAGQVLSKEAKQ